MDKSSGKNKGFAFVTFKLFTGVLDALKESSKKINDEIMVYHLATEMSTPHPQQVITEKIYMGRMPKHINSNDD